MMTQLLNDLLRNSKGALLLGLLVAFLTACGGSDDNGGPVNPGPPAGDGGGDNNGDDGGDDTGDDTGDDAGDDTGDDTDDQGAGDDTGDDADTSALTFETFQAASFVIGQQDFSAREPDQGGTAPDANTLDMPMSGVAYSSDAEVLFVADAGNSRVLGFNGIPDMNNVTADFVLGQPDFTSSERSEISATDMYSPEWVTTMGGRLMVTDTDLNRVTVYDGIPTSGNAEPVLVLGQSSMDTYSGNCDASTFIHPHAHLLTPDGKVIVADAANNRVLVWNEMPSENGAPADFVLGQEHFEICSFREPENFRHPAALWSDGEQLIVVDSEKHRVLVWNTFPTESFQEPDVILGQSSMEFAAPNDDDQDGETDAEGTPTARTLNYPRDIDVHEGKLYIADMDNHRVLIWNEIPTESFTPADNVLGQEDFTSNAMHAGEDGPNEQGFRRPVGVSVVEDQLFVTEWENSRVTVFEGQRSE